jgi:hypothetical protein
VSTRCRSAVAAFVGAALIPHPSAWKFERTWPCHATGAKSRMKIFGE